MKKLLFQNFNFLTTKKGKMSEKREQVIKRKKKKQTPNGSRRQPPPSLPYLYPLLSTSPSSPPSSLLHFSYSLI
jgi:hypothetical protein